MSCASALSTSPSMVSISSSSTWSDSSSEEATSQTSSSNSRHIRANEHLAVLLPRSLWKHDSLSSTCDTFSCATAFSFPIQRRHHCRKCGGIFCSACTSRTTPLLDTRSLPFLNPPRGVSIWEWESSESQSSLVHETARVCDDCWDQLHGIGCSTPSSPRLPVPALKPLKVETRPPSRRGSMASTSTSPDASPSPRTPSDLLDALDSLSVSSLPPTRRSSIISTRASNPDLRRRATLAQAKSKSTSPSQSPTQLPTIPSPSLEDPTLLPIGELRTYPLCRSSSLCKASGGGRWVPRPEMGGEDTRVRENDATSPSLSGKPLWQVEWERELSKEKRRRENPVVRGELGFCVRVFGNATWNSNPVSSSEEDEYLIEEPKPTMGPLGRSFSLSTF